MTILATVIVLGVLIFVHELGHFMAAKAVGVDVHRFSIGLGPKLFGFKRGETEYVLSAIPLGGYVKMGGMADDEVTGRLEGGAAPPKREPLPGDFDAKPLWARAIVITAGVAMNMIFAFAVYATAAYAWGFQEYATTRIGDVRAALLPDGAQSFANVASGARVEKVGDRPVENWGDIRAGILEAPAGIVYISLAEPTGSIQINPPAEAEERARWEGTLEAAVAHWVEPRVGALQPASPAEKGGIEAGDKILAVDGQPIGTWWDFVRAIESRPGQRTEVTLERGGTQVMRVVVPEVRQERDPVTGEERTLGRVGIFPPTEEMVYNRVGLGRAVVIGAQETVAVAGLIVGFLKDLVTGHVSARSVGSIVTIGEASGQAAAAGLESFLRFMALFSVNLAVLNLLPIPVLDGGHLLFLLIERLRGKALTIEQRLRWSNVGFLVVMGLMVWALSNDVMRLFGL
jgi:regulator of sigma E protease